MGYTASATTGVLGQRLIAGFDTADLFVDNMGERIDVWDRQVSYIGTATVRQAMSQDRWLRFDLLLNTVLREKNLSMSDEIEFYACGQIKELRHKKVAYRMRGTKYYGTNKNPIVEENHDDDV